MGKENALNYALIKEALKDFGFIGFDIAEIDPEDETDTYFFKTLKKIKTPEKFFHLFCVAYSNHFEIEFNIGETFESSTVVFRVKTDDFANGIILLKTFLALSGDFLEIDPNKTDMG